MKQWTYLREREIGSCRAEWDKYRPQGHGSILSTSKHIKINKNLFAFAAVVNPTTLHPQNSKSLIEVLHPAWWDSNEIQLISLGLSSHKQLYLIGLNF